MEDSDKPGLFQRILGWTTGISFSTWILIRIITLALKHENAKSEAAKLTPEGTPQKPALSPEAQAERDAALADIRPLADLLSQMESTHSSNLQLWSNAKNGAAQLAVLRDQILPGIREQKAKLEQMAPKTPRAMAAQIKMTQMVTNEFSGWIAVNNAAVARDWNKAGILFARMDSDRKAQSIQVKQAIGPQ